MLTRRELLERTTLAGAALALPPGVLAEDEGVLVNDMQSRLNATRVRRIVTPKSVDDVQAALRDAQREGRAVSVAGGRHSMGGQQFGRDTVLLDTRKLSRVIRLDRAKGHVEAEAGIEWPELVEHLVKEQSGQPKQWGIRQKQTGVDQVCLGGSLASNIHGRGLRFPPLVGDIESFDLVDASGKLHTCSRHENVELFSLAIGGYGLFGVVVRVTLRLAPRRKVQRVAEVIAVKELLPRIEKRLKEGFDYGDCQYSTDLGSDASAHPGVFSCYRPVSDDTPIPRGQKVLSGKDWAELYTLARTDKAKAFQRYSKYYLGTSGQVYWSDTHQLAGNFEGYRTAANPGRGTEMITEVYVSREQFLPFVRAVRKDFVEHKVDMTYGTIRFIEKDEETFLPWARQPWVCIVCNLHVVHTDEGKKKAAEDFRRILDRVVEAGGSYFLTYHRWATRKHVEACYPRFVEFLRLKRKYDPQERFQSDWYRHYKEMFKDKLRKGA
jgi:FAD/FMN-containing dehydrogenase